MTCDKCRLCEQKLHPCVMGEGNPHANLMLIGEAPGFNEDIEGRPFVGDAGQLLDFILDKLGLKRSKVWITNVIKCRPPKNKLPPVKELREVIWPACRVHLDREVGSVKPRVVVLLGGKALMLLAGIRTGIMKVEGTEVKPRVWACFHPAYALRSPSKEKNIAAVLYLAAKQAGLKVKPKGIETGCFDYEGRRGI